MESKAREAVYHLVLSSMDQLLERDEFDAWVDGEIEIAPLAFMRGRTLNAAFF